MNAANAKLEKITHLLKELQKELKSFPQYEKDLTEVYRSTNKQLTDIQHIIQNVDLTPYESIKIVAHTREVRLERQEANDLQEIIAPLQAGFSELLPVLNKNINLVNRQLNYAERDKAYTFRSDEAYQLLTDVVPDFQGRSTVPLHAPGTFVPMNEKPAIAVQRPVIQPAVELPIPAAPPEPNKPLPVKEALPEMPEIAEIAPLGIVTEHPPEPAPKVHVFKSPTAFDKVAALNTSSTCSIIRNRSEWLLYSGGKVIGKVIDLVNLMDKVFDREWDVISTNEQSRHLLLWELKQLKRSEPEKERVGKYETVLRKLDKSKGL